MISGSSASGEPIPPHFQFQKSIRIETICYMLNVRGFLGHAVKQLYPVSIVLNNKGGMDDAEFFEYIQKSIM
jgi:hypothetical protein